MGAKGPSPVRIGPDNAKLNGRHAAHAVRSTNTDLVSV
jgi:hypothetical protein